MSIPCKISDLLTIDKHPAAVLDYTIDWTLWLDGDIIKNSDWVVPTGITKDSQANDTKLALVWLSGGTDGVSYSVINEIETNLGRKESKEIVINVSSVGGE